MKLTNRNATPLAFIAVCALLQPNVAAKASSSHAHAERQLTTAPHHHFLGNAGVWSGDSQWIVYDSPPDPAYFSGTRIEAVNADTGQIRRLYEARNGANCGVAAWNPQQDEVVFILGPEQPDEQWNYAFSRRRGIIVSTSESPSVERNLDAMNYALPYTAGALRGGSHVHMFSADGQWLSFTYEDEVLAAKARNTVSAMPATAPSANNGTATEEAPEPNRRSIAIAVPGPVHVNRNHPRNHDGEYSSFIAVETVSNPRAGSDEISRAVEEAWIGTNGYLKADGMRQQRALAFQGTVTAADGTQHPEVFVADIPQPPFLAGGHPIEGTDTHYPAPPQGFTQRRLTFTDARQHPGIQGPRHWLKSSPDGSRIAFLMRDERGIVQLWLISPNGGTPTQLTHNTQSIASAFSWNSNGTRIAVVIDGSVCVVETVSGRSYRLTPRSDAANAPLPNACVFAPDDSRIAFVRPIADKETGVRYAQIFTVSVPEALIAATELR